MMKKLFLIATITALLVSCGTQGDKGPSEESLTVKSLKIVSSCTELDVSGDWCIELSDSVEQPTIVIDEALMEYVSIDLGDWELKLENKPRMMVRMKDYPKPCLQLPTHNVFEKINMGGSTELKGASTLVGRSLDLVMSEDAICKIDTMRFVEDLDIEMSGATTLRCQSMRMNELDVDMSGSSDAKLAVLEMQKDVNIDMSGASKMALHCEVLALNLDLTGSAELDLKGKAMELDANLSGSSWIDSFEENEKVASANLFIVDIAKVGIKGSAKMRFQCNDKLKVNAMGNAYVLYRGSPKTVVKSSGESKVEAM